jgi:hypothetical protein
MRVCWLTAVLVAVLDANEKSLDASNLSFSERRRLFRWKLFFRLIASMPSLIGALFKNNLGQILDYTGPWASDCVLVRFCRFTTPLSSLGLQAPLLF